MPTVRCSVCKKFTGTHCEVKKGKKVKPNKSRVCGLFEFEPEKVSIRTTLPSKRMPSILWENKSKLRGMMKKEEEYRKQMAEASKAPEFVPDEAHPLTGDLSRFVSTAGDSE